MKTRNFLLSGTLGIALAGVVLTGCHKSSTTPDTDYTAAEDEANASSAMNDSKNISDAGMQGSTVNYGAVRGVESISSHCTVSWSIDTSIGTVDTLYINFPNTPTLCNDGRYRQGEILVYWKNSFGNLWEAYFDSTSVITMSFRNYAAGSAASNMIGIAGSRMLTNLGRNALSEENWNFTANLTLTYNTGQTATWSSTRTNTLVEQGGVYYYEITGSANGVSRKGVSYTITITSPLYVTALPSWAGGCKYIESGSVKIIRTGALNTLYIAFGNVGDCDANAVATIAGVNYPFTMW